MKLRSLQLKLVVLILLALVPLGILLVRETATEYRERREALAVETIWYAGVLAGTHQAILETVRQFLMTLAQVETLLDPDTSSDQVQRLLEKMIRLNTVYDNIGVCDATGRIVNSARPLGHPESQAETQWFQRMLVTRDLSAGTVHPNAEGRPVVSIGYPIFDQNRELKGAVFVEIDLIASSRYNVREPLPMDGIILALSEENVILLRYPNPEKWIGRRAHRVNFARQLDGRSSGTFLAVDENGEERLYAVQAVRDTPGDPFFIGIGVKLPEDGTMLTAEEIRRLIAVAGIGLTVLLLSWAMGNRYLVRPTRHLVEMARSVSRGNLSQRNRLPSSTGEFHEIGAAMNQMADTLGTRIAELNEVRHDLQKAHDELETRVEERTDALRRSNAELEQFAYVASHDLQEPLRMVASYTQLLARRYADRLDEKGRDFIHYAVDGAERMQAFIRDLLQYSRVGTVQRPFQTVETGPLLRQVLENFRYSLDETGGKVELVEPLPVVSGDPLLLAQLFQNLIANAMKFRSEEPPRIRISAIERGEQVEFAFQDNGIGLDPSDAERIFVIFQRLHARNEYEGTGIGLSICKKIVERHGGEIWVNSRKGEGATFRFTLPKASP